MATTAQESGEGFAAWFRDRVAALGERSPCAIDGAWVPTEFRRAAVLMPFWLEGDRLQTLLTVRTQHVSSHKGQISFPGGRRDPDDHSLADTALRESWEEVSIEPSSVRLLGALDDAWSVGRYLVTPYVGWLDAPPRLVHAPSEIDRLIVADVQRLMEPHRHHRTEMQRGPLTFVMHAFDYDGDIVWGLTGALLAALFGFVRTGVVDLAANGEQGMRGWLQTRDPE